MARKTWEDIGGVAHAIVKGEHDADLHWINQACKQRIKQMFRKGQKVRIVGTGTPELDFKQGFIDKVNTKTISVDLGDELGIYNVSPNLVELVS